MAAIIMFILGTDDRNARSARPGPRRRVAGQRQSRRSECQGDQLRSATTTSRLDIPVLCRRLIWARLGFLDDEAVQTELLGLLTGQRRARSVRRRTRPSPVCRIPSGSSGFSTCSITRRPKDLCWHTSSAVTDGSRPRLPRFWTVLGRLGWPTSCVGRKPPWWPMRVFGLLDTVRWIRRGRCRRPSLHRSRGGVAELFVPGFTGRR